jgi:hypothetical protein
MHLRVQATVKLLRKRKDSDCRVIKLGGAILSNI